MGDGDRKGLRARMLDLLGVAAPSPNEAVRPTAFEVAPRTPSPDRAVERFLAHELRLPLATLARLGARMAEGGDAEQLVACGRALTRECERLDVLVTNALELGLVGEPLAAVGHAVVAEAAEKAIAGHRAWIEARRIRLRVLDGSQECTIRGERDDLIAALFALLGDLFDRVPAGASLELRLRDVNGVARVDVLASSLTATPSKRPQWERARDLIQQLGGECWDDAAAEGGFGVALPRSNGAAPLAVRRRRVVATPT